MTEGKSKENDFEFEIMRKLEIAEFKLAGSKGT